VKVFGEQLMVRVSLGGCCFHGARTTIATVRWALAIGLIAGCGRIGFDSLGAGDGTAGPGDDGGLIDAAGSGGGSGSSNSYYIAGGTATQTGPATSITTTTTPLIGTNMLLVVAIHWGNGSSSVTTVQDTSGNGFSSVGSMTRYNSAQSQIMWIKKVTAGTMIKVFFDQATTSIDLKWAAYRDIDQMSPTGGSLGGGGTGATADTGALSVSGPVVLVASSASSAPDASAGPNYAERQKSSGGVLEDRLTTQGSFNATTTLSSSNAWIIQVIALRPL
jgi:hypothetical protein